MEAEVFKAKFTTSDAAAQKKKDKRSDYFGDNVKLVVAKDEQSKTTK